MRTTSPPAPLSSTETYPAISAWRTGSVCGLRPVRISSSRPCAGRASGTRSRAGRRGWRRRRLQGPGKPWRHASIWEIAPPPLTVIMHVELPDVVRHFERALHVLRGRQPREVLLDRLPVDVTAPAPSRRNTRAIDVFRFPVATARFLTKAFTSPFQEISSGTGFCAACGCVRARVHLQVLENLATQGALGQHALDGLLERPRRLAGDDLLVGLCPETARVARVPVVQLLRGLASRDLDLLRVDDDNGVAQVPMGGVARACSFPAGSPRRARRAGRGPSLPRR